MCDITVERGAANLPQATQSAIFTVSGGRVLLTHLVPEVTTAIQNQGNGASVYANPAVGSDLEIWGLGNIQNKAAGQIFGYDQSGAAADGVSVAPFPKAPTVIPAGTIDLSCAASSTGQVKWTLMYRPLDPGAKVAAA